VAGAVEDVDGVGEEVGDGVEGFGCAFGASGEIYDERAAADGGDCAGEDGGGSFQHACAAHFLGDAGHDAVGVFLPSRSSVMKHSSPSGRRGAAGHKEVCPRCGSAFT